MAIVGGPNKPDRLLKPRNPIFDEDFFAEKLRDSETKAGLIRPLRNVYRHLECGSITKIELSLSVLLAKRPRNFIALRCLYCGFRPVQEYVWDGTNEKVGC